MEKHVQQYVDDFMAQIVAKNPGEKEFQQAVHEVVESLAEYILQNPVLQKMKVLERIAEPERVVMFRVPWLNDKGEIEINKGYHIEMNRDRKSTRLNSSHKHRSRMPSSA